MRSCLRKINSCRYLEPSLRRMKRYNKEAITKLHVFHSMFFVLLLLLLLSLLLFGSVI